MAVSMVLYETLYGGSEVYIFGGVDQGKAADMVNNAISMTGLASKPTEVVFDEIRISTTTYKPAAWLEYEQNQAMNHSTYTTYGPEA